MKVTAVVKNIDEELAYRSTVIRIGTERSILTPVCASSKALPASDINEIYRNYKKDGLTKGTKSFDEESRLNKELKDKKSEGLNLCFVDYNDSSNLNDDEFRLLMDLQYQNSDIAMTPVWSGLLRLKEENKLRDTILSWNKKAVEIIETLNNKSVMGTISMGTPRTMVGDIVNSMIEQGITLFAIDARNRFVDNQETWMRDVLRKINEYKMLDETFFYSVNPRSANFSHNAEIVLARDFLNSGYGVDVMGGLHIPNPGAGLAKHKMLAEGKEPFCRRFDESTYGYIRVPETQAAKALQVSTSRVIEEMKNYNLTRRADEANKIAILLTKERSIMPYLKSKAMVKNENIENLKKYRKDVFEEGQKKSPWFN